VLNISAEQVQKQALSNLAGDPVPMRLELTSFGTMEKLER